MAVETIAYVAVFFGAFTERDAHNFFRGFLEGKACMLDDPALEQRETNLDWIQIG